MQGVRLIGTHSTPGEPLDGCTVGFSFEPNLTGAAAIPLAELAPVAPKGRDAWSIGIQRIIPNIGQQSFTQPASIPERGETFGLMVFE